MKREQKAEGKTEGATPDKKSKKDKKDKKEKKEKKEKKHKRDKPDKHDGGKDKRQRHGPSRVEELEAQLAVARGEEAPKGRAAAAEESRAAEGGAQGSGKRYPDPDPGPAAASGKKVERYPDPLAAKGRSGSGSGSGSDSGSESDGSADDAREAADEARRKRAREASAADWDGKRTL